jgi:hypothetical protein
MIQFEQWELDDLQRELYAMLESHDTFADVMDTADALVVTLNPGLFGDYLARVVEVADRSHWHRQAVREAKYAPNIS